MEHAIDKIDWPVVSIDLNPIENLWAYLTRKVYQEGKQLSSINELKEAVLRKRSIFTKLVDFMKTRCVKLIQCNGKAIK